MSAEIYEEAAGTVRDVMKKVVSGGTELFAGTEQGRGKYSGGTLLLVRPSRMCKDQI